METTELPMENRVLRPDTLVETYWKLMGSQECGIISSVTYLPMNSPPVVTAILMPTKADLVKPWSHKTKTK